MTVRRSSRRQTTGNDFFMKQKVHMIANVTKNVLIDCTTCKGRGSDGRQQPCVECYGQGYSSSKITLYEYIGQVEIGGKVLSRTEGTSYSVRYFDLSHLHEDDRFEASTKLWREVDTGQRMMTGALWRPKVPAACLWWSFSKACEIASELNLSTLSRFPHKAAMDIIRAFNQTLNESSEDMFIGESETTYKTSFADDLIPAELMGESPELPYSSNTSNSVIASPVTESEYTRAHSGVKIEPVLR